MIKEIKTFEELWQIQDEEERATYILDLLLVRDSVRLIDGIALIIGADCHIHIQMIFVSNETYETFTEGQKEYLKRHYNV